ncbi:hypothetical protein MKX01_015517 [Papaver californicum]|nr:hypothetical protein MKX01_015517 [Papaver californicum]
MDDDVNSKDVILNSAVEDKVDKMDEGQKKKVSSEVLESRIHLINQLGDSKLSEASELASLFERFTASKCCFTSLV